jgi:hypothetical protein
MTSDWPAKVHSLTMTNLFRKAVYRILLFIFLNSDSFVGEAFESCTVWIGAALDSGTYSSRLIIPLTIWKIV